MLTPRIQGYCDAAENYNLCRVNGYYEFDPVYQVLKEGMVLYSSGIFSQPGMDSLIKYAPLICVCIPMCTDRNLPRIEKIMHRIGAVQFVVNMFICLIL